jgi:NAD(P)H dehydrogenase (quinone)
MLIITGANGTLGRGIVDQLLQRTMPDEVGVSVRDPEAAAPLAQRGVRVRRGDFAEPDSLREAFKDATQVLIVSSNTRGGDTVEQHRNAIEAAVAAGAQRILYTSHMGARPDSAFPPARSHFATEQILQECGVAFTSLRNGFYAVTPTYFLGSAPQTGLLAVPADGPVSWTTQADLAEVAAIALTEEGRLDGISPPLTAAQALGFDDVAAILSEITGREITRSVVSDKEFASALVAHGASEAQAAFSLAMFAAMRAGNFAAVDPTLEQLLGRPPTTLREVLAASQSAAETH